MADDPEADQDKLTRQMFPNYPDQKQIKEFYQAIGIALTAWQMVESALYLIFERSIVPKRPGSAGCAFHAPQHSKTQLAMADAAVRFAFFSADEEKRNDLIERWDKLRRKVDKKLTIRNHFAHFHAMTYFDQQIENERILLEPGIYDFRFAVGIRERKKYGINEIRTSAETFRKLSDDLYAFVKEIPPIKARR
jgi:hypothetical protein